ncbi:sulfate adenylyltransferase subunit CysN [Acidicapsa dinghuensis]|uniref:Sulfate adenylyltransferase subunit 1 n=1 Tax=Acidicapsa dinghuensis TaxID=2218256 RepID=A0ABW1EHJ7_9BACT|nr:sulfate adenylyltransferase subunit CysN [Acidicapsa dinghuensis]
MAATAFTGLTIHEFLREESQKDLLRFSTAGSVDDGKSTLIGRLLYDTQSVYEDQVRSIEGKGTTAPGQIDFALLTDGLRAEREQGITIDVAYRYFSTSRRKFIIADTPGHEQYTRNMATGASTADAAIVLVDARKGVLVQSRRHAYIASLLRVRHILVAVNKMDLVGFDEGVFHAIEKDFRELLEQIALETGNPVEAQFVPVSALLGDNVVHRSASMAWYEGPSILELLESVEPTADVDHASFRFPVQRVIRPDHTFRGFAGQIASGTVRQGDVVAVLPSGVRAQVERIVTWDGDLREASAPLSVTLVLDREIDISRGDLIVPIESQAQLATRVTAALVWMNQQPLELNKRYLIKHASRTAPAFVTGIEYRSDVATLGHEAATTLEMNSIGVVRLQLNSAIAFDPYGENRATGAFILIDPATNATVAAGMIRHGETGASAAVSATAGLGKVSLQEREAHWGHRGGVIEIAAPAGAVDAVERSLFSLGAAVIRIDADNEEFLIHPQLLDRITELQSNAGLLTIVERKREEGSSTARVGDVTVELNGNDAADVVTAIHRLLQSAGILRSTEKVNEA